ncbi:MAG: class B sortase [Lachnospiraceae bacterium]|nr:class B sortase [Lachnospiraceae bacterium]
MSRAKVYLVDPKNHLLSVRQKLGKTGVGILAFFVDVLIILVLTLLTVYGVYALWDSQQLYEEASSSQYTSYRPTEDNKFPSFIDLQHINPEVMGWIQVYGTKIDYPMVHSEDNNKYLNIDAYGNFSIPGAIFLHASSKKDFSDFCSIILGHHMAKSSMFGDLDKFEKEFFFRSHEYGNLYYEGKNHGLHFFAYMLEDAYEWELFMTGLKPGTEKAEEYLANILDKALYVRDIGVSADDRIVMLYTCSEEITNGRYLLLGRIEEEVYEDPFVRDMSAFNHFVESADALGIRERIRQLGVFGKTLIFFFFLILLFFLLDRLKKRRLQRKAERAMEREILRLMTKIEGGREDAPPETT